MGPTSQDKVMLYSEECNKGELHNQNIGWNLGPADVNSKTLCNFREEFTCRVCQTSSNLGNFLEDVNYVLLLGMMPLSAQDMVAALFSIPFSIMFFLLLEAQKKILQNVVRYTDSFRVFLSLPLVLYLKHFWGCCPQVLCSYSATMGKHLLGQPMQHNAVCRSYDCIRSKETIFCKYYGFRSSCCMSGELIKLATGRADLRLLITRESLPILYFCPFPWAWHSPV